MAVDVAEHGRGDVDCEDVVGIGEEANTGNHADLYVEPPEGVGYEKQERAKEGVGNIRELGIVDLGERGAALLIEYNRVATEDGSFSRAGGRLVSHVGSHLVDVERRKGGLEGRREWELVGRGCAVP